MAPRIRTSILVLCAAAGCFTALARRGVTAQTTVNVLTQRNDNARTGANLAETTLTPADVASGRFGLLQSFPVEGQVYAQPLYVGGLSVGGTPRNLLFVATEHNDVYAFDADGASAAPVWAVNLGPSAPQDPEQPGATIPGCDNMTPEIGITSTPVIDLPGRTIYVIAKTLDADGLYRQTLHALDLADGSSKRSAEIQATVATGNGPVTFDPRLHLNRPGLLLVNGAVYAGFGSHCDHGDYHGWVMGFDAASLAPAGVYLVTPDGPAGSVWQSGQGLAADAAGSIYAVTSNGAYTADGANASNAIVRLVRSGSTLRAVDFFMPRNTDYLNSEDMDLGSSGTLLIPGTNLLLTGGKEGTLYLADRSNLGGFDPYTDRVVQSFQGSDVPFSNNIHGSPVYWTSPSGPRLYMWAENEALKAFAFDGARIDPTPIQQSTVLAPWNAMPGGAISLSANGSASGSGIVWAAIAQMWDATHVAVDGVLRAFDAEDLSRELWNSDRDGADALGLFAKFAPPTVANGRVYVSTFSGAVRMYGLRPENPGGAGASPFGGTPAAIPGMIEAERFDDGGESVAYHDTSAGNSGGAYRSTDVDLEASGDSGGGYNAGWMQAGEWLQYTVAVASAGRYAVEVRVASEGAGGRFHVEMNGIDKTGPIAIPDTGGWQMWQSVVVSGIALDAGEQRLRLVADADGAGGALGNVNYLRITEASAGGSTPFGGARVSLPGRIKAENFDDGGRGVAYDDTTAGNSGGAYRATDVDIEPTNDAGGGYNVGWLQAGEWLTYSVDIAAAGAYTATFRVASPADGGTFHLEINGADVTGPLTVPSTGGWQTWRDVTVPVALPAGPARARFVVEAARAGIVGNLRSMTVARSAPPPGPAVPGVPGVVEAADFDAGGAGVSWYDTTAGNAGGAYRQTDVDLEECSEGGYDVGWIGAGEWVNYTVDVAAAGAHVVQLRVASPSGGGSMHVGFNTASSVWEKVSIPATGGWQTWTTVTVPVELGAGRQQMTLLFDASGFNISRIAIVRTP